jgi:uncharacterized caspase-like protein
MFAAIYLRIALMVLASIAAVVPASAMKRVALVIGNSTYVYVPQVPNPANDASAMAKMFEEAGFEVVLRRDVPNVEFRRVIREFALKARGADIAVVFFAGHGIEVKGTNYLIPTDAKLASDLDAVDEAISLDRILDSIDTVKLLRLVILDASRDNLFEGRMVRNFSNSRTVGRGLAEIVPAAPDMLVAYSAKPGSTAYDAVGQHSPFTSALLKHLAAPGLDVRIAMGRVRDEVLQSTENRQEPYTYGSLGKPEVFIVPPPARPKLDEKPIASLNQNADVRRDYELAIQSGSKEAIEAFLSQHPNGGLYTVFAQQQLAKLNAPAPAVAPPEAAQPSQENLTWDRIRTSDSPAVLRDFVTRFPNGPRALEAQRRLELLESAARQRVEERRKQDELRKKQEAEQRKQEDAGRKQQAIQQRKQEESRKQQEQAKAKPDPKARATASLVRHHSSGPATPIASITERIVDSRSLERFPTIEAPDRVAPGATVPVLVSLTVEQVTPEIKIGATGVGARKTPAGSLRLPMPEDVSAIPIKVVLRAPGFELDPGTPEESIIDLNRDGDSTIALFRITAQSDALGPKSLRVTFWRNTEFLASVSRPIEITPSAHPIARVMTEEPRKIQSAPAALAPNPQAARAERVIPIHVAPRPIDLTIELVYDDPRALGKGRVSIGSNFLGRLVHGAIDTPADLREWLESHYREFLVTGTGMTRAEAEGSGFSDPASRIARLRGFGEELYRRAAPRALKQTLAALMADPNVTIRTVQIYSNNPVVPWELMRVPKADGEWTDFLGIAFSLARWHEDDDAKAVKRPITDLAFQEVVAFAPIYSKDDALAATAGEIDSIQKLLSARRIPGKRSDFITVMRNPPEGIIHFAGHGTVSGKAAFDRRYAILLEDGGFDVTEWRGLASSRIARPTLFFFNACEIGQAESVAGAVEGWAPAILARGASGYIGGLWPLRDEPAARFSEAFYQAVSTRLAQSSRASVAEALSEARRLVYETGDPTFLGYAFYGDAQLQFVRPQPH